MWALVAGCVKKGMFINDLCLKSQREKTSFVMRMTPNLRIKFLAFPVRKRIVDCLSSHQSTITISYKAHLSIKIPFFTLLVFQSTRRINKAGIIEQRYKYTIQLSQGLLQEVHTSQDCELQKPYYTKCVFVQRPKRPFTTYTKMIS